MEKDFGNSCEMMKSIKNALSKTKALFPHLSKQFKTPEFGYNSRSILLFSTKEHPPMHEPRRIILSNKSIDYFKFCWSAIFLIQ